MFQWASCFVGCELFESALSSQGLSRPIIVYVWVVRASLIKVRFSLRAAIVLREASLYWLTQASIFNEVQVGFWY